MMPRPMTRKERILMIERLQVAGLKLKMLKHTGYKRARSRKNALF